MSTFHKPELADRFRGFLPVVIDVETGGFNAQSDALLEIAAVTVAMDEDGFLYPDRSVNCPVIPFENANIEQAALEFTGIDPSDPNRAAMSEHDALNSIFKMVRKAMKSAGCTRAILVGHNANFDLGFLNAAIERSGIKRSPFHPFCNFDTATLAGLVYGQTVLARACQSADISFSNSEAHSALYDTEKTAELFCGMVNRWKEIGGWEMYGDQG